eukprot:m.24145 g.24145  ORF g.24145 m.24145 type:complete len:171 (-) comp14480_c1_seq1:125-637(-)
MSSLKLIKKFSKLSLLERTQLAKETKIIYESPIWVPVFEAAEKKHPSLFTKSNCNPSKPVVFSADATRRRYNHLMKGTVMEATWAISLTKRDRMDEFVEKVTEITQGGAEYKKNKQVSQEAFEAAIAQVSEEFQPDPLADGEESPMSPSEVDAGMEALFDLLERTGTRKE